MNSNTDEYINPLIQRYSSAQMSYIFSPDFKFTTWRKLWIALAECEMQLGLPVSSEQIEEMKSQIHNIDYELAKKIEANTRHDVMAHVHTFGAACPKAKSIIHLGATSAFVGDNTDLIQIKRASTLLLQRMAPLFKTLRDFTLTYRNLPTLGFTHFQPAQCTTVGKRACLWAYDLLLDFEALSYFVTNLPFRGVKGTTGTQASYLKLFNNDHEKVKKLDSMVAQKMGYTKLFPVTGQTYTRKIDAQISSILSGLAQSLHKIANDIRLLQHLKEIEEPFEKKQVGSSAMAYKRNPMRSERLTAIARFILSLSSSPAMTAAEQWFERTLDDSANKRLSIPQLFLAADAALIIALDICDGLVVYPNVIFQHIKQELPFMATENIIMEAVKKGGDRQIIHERIRNHSIEASKKIKQRGQKNDLLERIISDDTINLNKEEIEKIFNINHFIGRAPQQTVEFVREYLEPLLAKCKNYGFAEKINLNV
ncbi:MAG: adenylosuccinate lyase [Chitinispirillia bacterium]|jgi:adenylosuccinate lyase